MLLQIRPIAVRTAVVSFFTIGIVGSLAGLSPSTCCKRAVLGAVIVYVVTSAAVRVITAILTQAIIADRVNKEYPGDNEG